MLRYPEKYNNLIDQETWAFIEQTSAHYPPDAVSLPIHEQRRVYNSMCKTFNGDPVENVTSSDIHLNYIPGELSLDSAYARSASATPVTLQQRLYSRANSSQDAAIVYFHGGGFVVGDLDSHHSICAEITASTGCDLIATNYRLLPEHQSLAAFEDALAALANALIKYPRIVLCGDSAGASLCAAIAHTYRNNLLAQHAPARSDNQIAGQVLIYPTLGGDLSSAAAVEHQYAPLLTREDILIFENLRRAEHKLDYRLAPLTDNNFARLPPTICFSAQCDPLADDGKHYCEAIAAAGGRAQYHCEHGLVHGFLRARHSAARARASFSRICSAVSELVRND